MRNARPTPLTVTSRSRATHLTRPSRRTLLPTLAALALALTLSAPVAPVSRAQTTQPATPPGPAAPMRLASPADLQAMFDAGQYRLCLQQLSRTLQALPRDATVPRADLLVLRAEALIQMGDQTTARETTTTVEKLLSDATANDAARLVMARARALRLLIAASKAGTFDPGGGAPPIKLTDLTARKAAYAALLDRALADAKAGLDKALAATDLPTCKDTLPRITDAQCLELVATGADAQSRALYDKLGEHARGLIDAELARISQRVSDIRTASDRVDGVVTAGGWWWGGVPLRRGLWSTDRDALRDALATLDQIADVCTRASAFARNSGGDPKKWTDLRSRTIVLSERARTLLDSE